jgi:hypothetical protein
MTRKQNPKQSNRPSRVRGRHRHGLYTREAIAERRALRALMRGFREDAHGALNPGAKPWRARS